MNVIPKISIIVPVYNAEDVLERCINSVLDQSFRDFELLLINDGSEDKSGGICKNFQQIDDRIRVFHKANEGVSSARNLGIENAIGEWVCFIDSDDTVAVTYLEDFGFSPDINSDFCLQGRVRINADGKRAIETLSRSSFNSLMDFFVCAETEKFLNTPWAKLFLNDIIKREKIRFDDRFSLGEDHLFTLEYFQYVKSFLYKDKAGYNYFKGREGSLSLRLIDIRAYRRNIAIVNSLKLKVANKNDATESQIAALKRHNNYYIIVRLAVQLFDIQQCVTNQFFAEEMKENIQLMHPNAGFSSKKESLICNLIYRIINSSTIGVSSKVKMLSVLRWCYIRMKGVRK